MKITTVLLFVFVALLFNIACSKSVQDVFETEDMNSDFEDDRTQGDLQKRGYYWIVSAWGPCQCHGDMATGVQYRAVSCTKTPCHFIRAPRFKKDCPCL